MKNERALQGERRTSWARVIMPWSLAAAMLGYFGPWVAHRDAGLVINGQDLAEFVKFLPEVRSGQATMIRELFYLPLWATAISLILLGSNRRLAYPLWLRVVMWLFAPILATAALPPAYTPPMLLTPEFRTQTAIIGLCLLLWAGQWLLRGWPLRRMVGIVAGLSLAAATLPQWQFFAIRPAIATAYGAPIRVGWGLWLTALGFIAVAATGAAVLIGRAEDW